MKASDEEKKEIWRKVYDYVATIDTQEFELMNYGYDGEQGLDGGAEDESVSHRMYRHVMGRADLRGKDVLEIGCGRGGGAAFAKRFFAPARLCGMDFSAKAIDICRQRYGGIDGLEFRCGDAESLPFSPGEFDAVVNIESSHCYASRPKFYEETWRVLKPGGDLLYADFFPSPGQSRDQLKAAGFLTVVEQDITDGVIRSLDKDHARKEKLFRELPQPKRSHLENWAGLIGSPVYEAFRNRRYHYLSFHLRKPDSP
jgi:ubiquinone/menaquinone biosynthesis C-methylase UbiE